MSNGRIRRKRAKKIAQRMSEIVFDIFNEHRHDVEIVIDNSAFDSQVLDAVNKEDVND